jgi:hypothetical protein
VADTDSDDSEATIDLREPRVHPKYLLLKVEEYRKELEAFRASGEVVEARLLALQYKRSALNAEILSVQTEATRILEELVRLAGRVQLRKNT